MNCVFVVFILVEIYCMAYVDFLLVLLRAAYSHLLLPVPKIMWSFWKRMPDAPKVVSSTRARPKNPPWKNMSFSLGVLRAIFAATSLQVLTLFLEACLASWNLAEMLAGARDNGIFDRSGQKFLETLKTYSCVEWAG